MNSTQCEVASLVARGRAQKAQVSAGNVVHLGEPADDRVLFGHDATQRVELCLQDDKIVFETRYLVRGVVQGLGNVCFSPRIDASGDRDE